MILVSVSRADLSANEARRIALAAQGFGARRPAAPGRPALRRLVARLGVIQIDSVNVLARAHYLPAFSRLGPYPVAVLDRMSQRAPRELFEYWGHEASLLPVAAQPLFRWRMEEAVAEAWRGMRRIARDKPGFVEEVLAQVRERGPVAASELESERPRRTGPWSGGAGGKGSARPGEGGSSPHWWDWHDAKVAIEFLFWAGRVTSAGRRGFERLYDLPERVLPAAVLAAPTPDRADAQRELVMIAARALGVATEADLRDYFRLGPADGRARVAELAEAGRLRPVTVAGWRRPAYLDPAARAPRRVRARALLAPFDPLVWNRERTERLFGLRYRIEIYVPAPKRVHGYYVLPFLLGDRLVARVDLKADRKASRLRVQAAHLEPGQDAAQVAPELAAELRSLAGWLGPEEVAVAGAGDLAPALAISV